MAAKVNFEVEGHHNYFATPARLLVHNCDWLTANNGTGHHVPSKKAFENHPNYDYKDVNTISNADLERLGVQHKDISGNQNRLYHEHIRSGEPLTWEKMAEIEYKAMVEAGMDEAIATDIVDAAIRDLQARGVEPTRIPWQR